MKLLSKISLILVLTVISCEESNKERIELCETEIQLLQNKADSLSKLLNEKETKINHWFDPEFDGQKFTHFGTDNPTEYVEKSLREKSELIPLDAVLGGTMNFGNIQLLGNKWLIAEFDDGHIYGTAIYKYKLNKDGELEFDLLVHTDPAE